MNTTTTTNTAETVADKPKVIRKPRAQKPKVEATAEPKVEPKVKAAPKPKAEKPVKPSIPIYNFDTGYVDGPSDTLNTRVSRTPVDLGRFGAFPNATMTARDQASVEALRKQFGTKNFERRNLDAGVLRRLGERGCIEHVSGDEVSANTSFKLTRKGLGLPEARAKRTAAG